MTLEELKFFTEQFGQMRQEFKQEVKELKEHIDKTLGGHGEQLDDHEARLSEVEKFHWRLTFICGAIVFITQVIINAIIEVLKS